MKENSLIIRQIMELGKLLKCGSCDPKELVLWKTNYAFESWSESSTNSFINHVRQQAWTSEGASLKKRPGRRGMASPGSNPEEGIFMTTGGKHP